ncbi:hypothetical protein BD779DRAFT_698206 [Infundibulicybe gibba]|nr:hypothetical protein BD779DRAFT_698206 [Infundibulicybe gibba]
MNFSGSAGAVSLWARSVASRVASSRPVTLASPCGWYPASSACPTYVSKSRSLVLSLHLFNLLFLRRRATRTGLWLTLMFVWGTIITTVVIGPLAMQTPKKGPYFGISGQWCWITANYPTQQVYLEYFISLIAAGFEFLLYTAVLMRVRGNLVHEAGRWRFRFVPPDQSWKLGLARDLIDGSMLKVAQNMVWYPVAYTVLLVPITLSRLSEFAGNTVPLWATMLTATIFNLTGFVNVLLLLYTESIFPEAGTLPEYSTPRKCFNTSLTKSGGITPYIIDRSDAPDRYIKECIVVTVQSPTLPSLAHSPRSSVRSISSFDSYYYHSEPKMPNQIW